MRFLPTSFHAAIDYLWGALLVASPFALGFAADRPSLLTAEVFGAGAILYSLLTDYELGVVRIIPMRVHLGLDVVAGLALALVPFALSLDGRARWTFVLFGLFAVLASAITKTAPVTTTPLPARPRQG